MAEAAEREQQLEPAVPATTGAAPALGGGVSDLAGAGQSRPSLNRGTVMRLQGSAGNAAVNGLMAGRRNDSAVRTVTTPAPGDAALMRAMVARTPARETAPIVDEQRDTVLEQLLNETTTRGAAAGTAPNAARGETEPETAPAAGESTGSAPAHGAAPAPTGGVPAAAPWLGAAAGGVSDVAPALGTSAVGGATAGGEADVSPAPATGGATSPTLDTAAASGTSGAAPALGAAAVGGAAAGGVADVAPALGAAAVGGAATGGVADVAPELGSAAMGGATANGAPAPAPAVAAGSATTDAAAAAPGAADAAAPAPGAAVAPAPGVDPAGAVGAEGAAGIAGAAGPGGDVAAVLGAVSGGAAAGPVSVLGNPGAIGGAMGGVAEAVSGGLNAAPVAGSAAGPAAASGVAMPDVGAEPAGGESEGGAAQEGPSDEEVAEIEAQLQAGPPQAEPEAEAGPAVSAPETVVLAEPEPAAAGAADAHTESATPEPAADTAPSGDAAAPAAVPDAPELETETAPEPVEEPATEDTGGGEAVLARAPATELLEPPTEDLAPEPDAEPAVDEGTVAAEAQGELEAMGASGGGEYAGGGGGGGGGGGAVEAEPEQPAPDVSNADPAQAVSTAATLKPAQMLETLGGAEKAAATHVTKEHEKLAAQPPELEAGGGADGPSADEKHVTAPPTRPTTTKAAQKTGGEPEKPAPTPAPPPKAPLPAGPALTPDEKGNVSEGDGAKIKAAIDALPTSDGAVAVPPISTPKLSLTGAADPSQLQEQKGHLDQTVSKATAQGAQEVAEPQGENDLAPTVKPEKIKAEIPAGTAQAAPGAAGPGADDDTASIVAEQESGPQLKAAASQAAAQIGTEKAQHAQKAAQTKAAAQEEAQAEEAKGKADQIAEHAAAKAGVSKARQDWSSEQKQQADEAKLEATGAAGEAQAAIQTEKGRAEQEAIKHVDAGRKEAEDAKRKGDEEAKREKDKAKEDSGGGGFFGWVASKAKALYDKVKDGITAVFNKVRSAITTAINKAKELAHSVIDRAVKFVADKVKSVASKLLAIGDKLIPGFAAARQKFGKWIKDRVKQAVTALNKIVTAVKDGIRRVMTAVGNALKQGLDLLKKGISAAIDAVKNVVKAAIEKAKAAIAALGQFAAIIKDIASNPGQWLSNLGAAVMDGIKNHLWKALKTAVQTWFNEKLESLLGLGKSVLNLLTKGGISMAQVGKMAFEALKAAIPPALIALLVERLVSMIVPAAGAVMAVVQGLMAAWGAIQKILAAIDRFIAFLKAVKSGGAGPAFANALAAAAVAVIEFVSQFLLRKIAGAASKVAGKIKAIAQKIGKKLMAAMKKVGRKIKAGAKRLKDKVFKKKQPSKKTDPKKDNKKDDKQDKQDRLDKAVRELTPKVRALVEKGVGRLRLKAQLGMWRLRYRLSSLEITGAGKSVGVRAKVNPEADIIRNVIMTTGDLLHEQVERVWPIVIKDSRVQAAVQKMRQQRTDSWDDKTDEQSKKGRQTVGPYNRSTVDDPGVGGAAGVDVGTGLLGADGKPLPSHTIETTRFLDSTGSPLASTSERREAGGPGMIFVTGGGRYHERSDIANMSLAESQTFGAALLALQSRQPIPAGVDVNMLKEFARLGAVEQGRDRGAFVTVPMLAQLMAHGKVTAGEALLNHQVADIGGMDISRRAREQKRRQENVFDALSRGEDPKKRDMKPPWAKPRKWTQGDQAMEEPWETATGRFWDREKQAVTKWLELRMLVEPQYFATEQAFMNLLKNDMPEYLANHIINGTMLQLPASKPAGPAPGAVGAASDGMLD